MSHPASTPRVSPRTTWSLEVRRFASGKPQLPLWPPETETHNVSRSPIASTSRARTTDISLSDGQHTSASVQRLRASKDRSVLKKWYADSLTGRSTKVLSFGGQTSGFAVCGLCTFSSARLSGTRVTFQV